ncbi:MAG: FISUMP domain-containing protein [Bacteroidota bacterium]
MKSSVLVSVLVFLVSFSIVGQEMGEFVDDRDGKTYKIVTIDIELEGGVFIKRTWMAQNLNFEVPGSFCYKDEPAYCEAYGRLYTFEAAVAACPEGWHVPTIGEWNLLFQSFGGIRKSGTALQKDGESGLNLTLGGFGDPGSVFKNIGISGNYWDAEKKSASTSGLVSVQKGSSEVYHSAIGNWHRNSCRCVKD